MSEGYKTLIVEKRGQVDWLTLNRPEALNSISADMVGELNDYFGKLYHDRSVRVVVMRGAGKAYCAGLDIKENSGREPGAIPFGGGFGFQGWLADVYIKMRRCPQPTVSLVHWSGLRRWLCLCACFRHPHCWRKRTNECGLHPHRSFLVRHGRQLFPAASGWCMIASELMLTAASSRRNVRLRSGWWQRLFLMTSWRLRPNLGSKTCSTHRPWGCE